MYPSHPHGAWIYILNFSDGARGKFIKYPLLLKAIHKYVSTYITLDPFLLQILSHLSLILSRSLMRISETSFHREKNCKNWFTFVHVYFLVSSWLSIVLVDRLLVKRRHWLISLLLLYLTTVHVVVKLDKDYLIFYLQTCDTDEDKEYLLEAVS